MCQIVADADDVVGSNRRRIGVVAMVVARAIRTIMANKVGEITPRSRPMFKTISSISPRVFIRMPSEAEVRESSPVNFAATNVPPNFPTVATMIINKQNHQSGHSESSPIWVRVPV